MGKNNKDFGNCPLCGCHYEGKSHERTKHHVFPKYWYDEGITCFACHECHQVEFNHQYDMRLSGHPWTPKQCLKYWAEFCKSKGKDAFRIYPQLRPYKHLLYK